MKIIILIVTTLSWLYPSTVFSKNGVPQNNLSRIQFEQEVNINEVKKSAESYRVLREVNYKLDSRYVTTRVKTVWYFSNLNDIQELGQSSISFDKNTQKVSLINAATILPDGEIYNLTFDDVKEIDSNTYNVFSSWQELLINFPKLDLGGFSVLEYEITTDLQKKELDWSVSQFPQIFYKTGQFKLSATWTNEFKPKIGINSSFLKCEDHSNSIVCSAKSVPAAIMDKNIYGYDELGHIELGELTSWDDVISLTMKNFKSAYSSSPKHLQDFLKHELGENPSRAKAIDFIHQFSSRNIRYLSKSEHGHAVIPHKTEKTLDSKIGDCKDKTALFIDLAKQVGIKAYPVLVSTNRQKITNDLVPSLSKFNHVIACYMHNNKEFCSDLTDTETHWKNTSSWVQNKFSLRIIPNNKPQLLMSERYRWKYDVVTNIKLNNDGGQEEKQTRTYGNLYSAWFKEQANGKKKEELQRFLTDSYQEVVANQSAPSISISGLNQMNSNVEIQSITSFKPFQDTKENLDYSEVDAWLLNEVKNSYPTNQFYGEYIAGTSVNSRYIYDIPKLWQITVKPADIQLNHKFGSLSRHSSIDKSGKLVIETSLNLPSTYIEQSDLESYSLFLDALRQELTMRIFGNSTS